MKKTRKNLFMLSTLALLLSSCSTFFDKDNTPPPAPLVSIHQEARVQPIWFSSTGAGSDSEYLKLAPAINDQLIFTASKTGIVTATDKNTGKTIWSMNANADLSGGVAADNTQVYIGTHHGELLALHQADGSLAWKTPVASEILAPVSAKNGVVLVKTINDQITALSATDGHTLWHYQEAVPSLILRGSSSPQITGNSAVVGFENGKLLKMNLQTGSENWQQTIADPEGVFAIQRMVDIDADPIILGNHVYAATYQGQIAALDLSSGNQSWSHDISSYSGIAADGRTVFVSDAESHIWAFDAGNGAVKWQQEDLYARNITGPAVIGNYIVVGDAEGYLHWISKSDGHFVARSFTGNAGILATPVVKDDVVYVYTKDGHLAAYTVNAS